MSIQIRCPNGHVLRVKESFAGRIGLCPACKAPVKVPQIHRSLTEDDIIEVLGPHDASRKPPGSNGEAADDPIELGPTQGKNGPSPPKKICAKCNREISAGTHICPFCRTYIANLSDL
ncbi:MAG: hypothetical protein JW818_23290 [Pirellulales bacterium]|nr:hypothetical protein [Pirellulales bacterium]